MLYAALTFWLSVTVLMAWGVHQLWSGVVQPRVFNAALLPGTLVAQLGHVVGMLVTGGTISNTTLYKDDETGAPESTPNPEPRIPILGPIVVGMLPVVACGGAIYLLARGYFGLSFPALDFRAVGPELPTGLAGFWQLLRDQVTLAESLVDAVLSADFGRLETWLFLYLLTCFCVRIAPFPGNLRGSLAAIVLLGVLAALAASIFGMADPRIQNCWGVLNLTVGALLLLLLLSLAFRGAIGLYRVIRGEQG